MSNIESCADCGKRFGFTERIFSKTNGLWICEDCAIKEMQENNNKDQQIAELEEQLAESEERCGKQYAKIQGDTDYICKLEKELKQRKEMFITLQEQCANDYTKLAKENEILNKALDLACQTLYDINFQMYNTEMDFKEYYKQQALTHQQEDKGE